ncbi:hypothetical protein [Bacillus sp. AFS017336]|uniref:hypothetical protein n=1 Tax=Bacillus sp. AFS017336 TaxID=2033489 RepID=UPI0015CF0895|nr:hypothetical protein [Bacillus sp. AFS017336]
MLDMYVFGGILIITMLTAVYFTRKDSGNSEYSKKRANRIRIARERKAGKVVGNTEFK